MSRPLCTNSTCERTAMRQREGSWWCMFHPDSEPPPEKPVKVMHAPQAKPRPAVDVEAERCPRTPSCPKPARHPGACPSGVRVSHRGRTVQMPVRVTEDEATVVRTAAKAAGLSLNDYLRGRILGAQEGPPL